MIEQLRKIFPSIISYEHLIKKDTEEYQWFLTDNKEIVGINRNELQDRDTELLHAFMRPYDISLPEITEKEEYWRSIVSSDKVPDKDGPASYRLIYFSFQRLQTDSSSFKEAVHEFFGKEVPILWENDHEGIIVEGDIEEQISYEQIMDVFMSDLYVKIKFLIGPYLQSLSDAKRSYQALQTSAGPVFDLADKDVLTYAEAIPYLLLSKTDSGLRTNITEIILGELAEDTEMIQTIEAFIDSNLNVSVTAKELYMHRNSLQYRLDKFTEKTGIDVRQFQQALSVQLALISLKALQSEN